MHVNILQYQHCQKLNGRERDINRWENGRAKPSPLAIKQIEELLRSMGDDGDDLPKRGFLK